MKESGKMRTILILGSGGFIGSNIFSFFERDFIIKTFKIGEDYSILKEKVSESDIIIHSAGVSKSDEESDFFKINIEFSSQLSLLLTELKDKIIIYFSSIHFIREDLYGFSKRYNEYLFSRSALIENNGSFSIRTPGVFGPGSRPNYVSVVSTFCFNLANNISSNVIDPDKVIKLTYIGNILKIIESVIYDPFSKGYFVIEPTSVQISIGELYSLIYKISTGTKVYSDDFDNVEFVNQVISTYKYYKFYAK
jgi:UDP-2-acetamido-2,6-beta-L-arabino-hexul-4-ose reductase